MADYDDLADRMDAEVDTRLGSSISYAADGVTFVALKGFPVAADGLTINPQSPLDPMGQGRKFVKIRTTLIPAPSATHRLRAAFLGAGLTFRPTNRKHSVQGRYHIIEVEKAA